MLRLGCIDYLLCSFRAFRIRAGLIAHRIWAVVASFEAIGVARTVIQAIVAVSDALRSANSQSDSENFFS